MRAALIAFLLACLIAGLPAAAAAQERGQVGITMGYPASIGVLWHVSDRVAVRPEFSFSRTDSSSDGIVDASTEFWSVGTGVSALFFWPVRDNLRTYVAPRFSYTRTQGNSDVTQSTTNAYTIAGMVGAHYSLSHRFAAFGEVGFGYARQTGTATTTIATELRTTNHGNSVGTRTGVGVILYF